MSLTNLEDKQPSILAGQGIPNYQEITPSSIKEYFPNLIDELNNELTIFEKDLTKILNRVNGISWEEVINPLHKIEERLRWSWSAICHLNSVRNTNELRDAHSSQQPSVVRFGNRIGQSKIIYKALLSLKNHPANLLGETQKRILETELRSMNHRGVGLDQSKQKEFNKNSERLAELSTIFSNNVLDATKNWSLLLTKKSDIEGLNLRELEILAEAAHQAGDLNANKKNPTAKEGPWRIGLDMPSYLPFMSNGANGEIRETLYKAYVRRASFGESDNRKIIEEILTLRNQQAKVLGHKHWASLSLSSKMAKDVKSVEDLLEELRSASILKAKNELEDLKACAKRNGMPNDTVLAPWDINYWSERLRKERFDLDKDALRPWFPLQKVLNGLFNLCERLFEITIEHADLEVPKWHSDVEFYKVLDKDKSTIAYFYLDPYSRPNNKRGGAWMDECLVKSKSPNGENILPIAYLVCNQTPPTKEMPSLMSFEEVETLFHEFGHGLQHMLTKVDYPQAAGINNVEWDAVELPSQFMENWCLDKNTVFGMAKHWQNGTPLPEKEFKKLLLSRTFNSGLSTLRQIHFALTDLRLHSEWRKELGISPDEMRREIAKSTTVMQPIKEDQFLCAFNHIFAGGYAAGYYSYKWAEVLSSDAFAAFEEVKNDNETQIKAIGKKFRETILSLGGSRSPQEVFQSFRGRSANTEALIRHSGLNSNL